MKYLVVIPDGMADEKIDALGGMTPMQKASKPCMDALASQSLVGTVSNVPEGMVIIGPMLATGVKPRRTFLIALLTGLIEVIGTLIGYFAVSLANAILPFALAFAGGTMLYVISDEMIPETHAHGAQRGATYALLVGFCVMMAFDVFLG